MHPATGFMRTRGSILYVCRQNLLTLGRFSSMDFGCVRKGRWTMTSEREQIGGNSRFTLPDDHAEALAYVVAQIERLQNARRTHSELITEVKKEAKNDFKIDSRSLGLSVRLSKMTPERRQKWVDEMVAGARMFGVTVDWAEHEVDDPDRKKFVDRIRNLEADRRGISEQIREMRVIAKDNGFDLRAVRLLLELRKLNDTGEEAEDFFHKLDSYGAKLALW